MTNEMLIDIIFKKNRLPFGQNETVMKLIHMTIFFFFLKTNRLQKSP